MDDARPVPVKQFEPKACEKSGSVMTPIRNLNTHRNICIQPNANAGENSQERVSLPFFFDNNSSVFERNTAERNKLNPKTFSYALVLDSCV
jgi:hypothetical protein